MLLGQQVEYSLCTLLRQTVVDGRITSTTVSITSYLYGSIGVSIQVVSNFLNLNKLLLSNSCLVDVEEHVATEWLLHNNSICRLNGRTWFLDDLLDNLLNDALNRLWSLDGASGVSRTEVDLHTSQCVEVPVPVLSLLTIVVVAQGVGIYFQAQAYCFAYFEVGSNTCTSITTNLCTSPSISQVLRIITISQSFLIILIYKSNILPVAFLVHTPTDVGTTTDECAQVEDTVRIVTINRVRQVECEIDARSNVHPLPLYSATRTGSSCRALSTLTSDFWILERGQINTSTALPSVH